MLLVCRGMSCVLALPSRRVPQRTKFSTFFFFKTTFLSVYHSLNHCITTVHVIFCPYVIMRTRLFWKVVLCCGTRRTFLLYGQWCFPSFCTSSCLINCTTGRTLCVVMYNQHTVSNKKQHVPTIPSLPVVNKPVLIAGSFPLHHLSGHTTRHLKYSINMSSAHSDNINSTSLT